MVEEVYGEFISYVMFMHSLLFEEENKFIHSLTVSAVVMLCSSNCAHTTVCIALSVLGDVVSGDWVLLDEDMKTSASLTSLLSLLTFFLFTTLITFSDRLSPV